MAFLGHHDRTLKELRNQLEASLVVRGNQIRIRGEPAQVAQAERIIRDMLALIRHGTELGPRTLEHTLEEFRQGGSQEEVATSPYSGLPPRIRPKTAGQKTYLEAIASHDLVFAIGPAGTGKSYLAVAMAVAALKSRQVKRIILTRPAVEAGERLGFLPGDIQAKVDPYLRPLYDALFDMIDTERVDRFLQSGVIEVAPLAYMRGRTLNDAFIILDEAQNTTSEQMKMFLTRIGFSSQAVITGDVTQTDLPRGTASGLSEAREVLAGIEGIAFVTLRDTDVVRHPLVARIIQAYEKASTKS
jgi:phosphate starvation-inducible PhoH-like protein